MTRQELCKHCGYMYKYVTCLTCGCEAKLKGVYYKNSKSWSFYGPLWCRKCDKSICDECGSTNLKGYDDGEGYPPNILCKECGHWPQ